MSVLPNWVDGRSNKRRDVEMSLTTAYEMLGRPARVALCLPGNSAACVLQGVDIGLYASGITQIIGFERDDKEFPLVRKAMKGLPLKNPAPILIQSSLESEGLDAYKGRVDLIHLDLLGHPTFDMAEWMRNRLPVLMTQDGLVIVTVQARAATRANPYAMLFDEDKKWFDQAAMEEGLLRQNLRQASELLVDKYSRPYHREDEDLRRISCMLLMAMNAGRAIVFPSYTDGSIPMRTFIISAQHILGHPACSLSTDREARVLWNHVTPFKEFVDSLEIFIGHIRPMLPPETKTDDLDALCTALMAALEARGNREDLVLHSAIQAYQNLTKMS